MKKLVFTLLLATSAMGQEATQGYQASKTSVVERFNMVVNGQNTQMRMAIASIANNMGKELAVLLEEESGVSSKRPIAVEMFEKGSSKKNLGVRPRVTPFEDGELLIDLLVDTRTQVDRAVLSHGLLEVMLYRRGLEGIRTLEEGRNPRVPAWLSSGLLGAMAWDKGVEPRKVYEHLLKNPQLFSLSRLFSGSARSVQGFDSTDRVFFQAAATAMVRTMLNQEGGAEGMRSFLREVVLYEGEMESLLQKHFSFASAGSNAIQKAWSLQLAEMSTAKLTESFSIAETEERLTEILFFELLVEEGMFENVDLLDLSLLEHLSGKQRAQAVEVMRQEVMQLSNRSHPLYRPLLIEYLQGSKEVADGKLAIAQQRFARLAGLRDVFIEQDQRCKDYLDWYQISRARELTGDFDGYRELIDELSAGNARRKDAEIDAYLDRMQSLLSGGQR